MNNVVVTIKIESTLKLLLAEHNLSIRELSKRSGVPNSTLQEWLSNRSPKNPLQVQKVAQVLGVSMHYLIFGEEDKTEPLTKLLKEDVLSFWKGREIKKCPSCAEQVKSEANKCKHCGYDFSILTEADRICKIEEESSKIKVF